MADRDQRDRAIERLLRSGAGAGAGAGAACVDGETLAAWSSGALAQTDAARVEEHLADCARCQAMLAAFARTEPVAPAPWLARLRFSEGAWRGYRVRWLVPLATAAVVAAIWVAGPRPNAPAPSIADSGQIAQLESPSALPESVPAPPVPPPAASRAPAQLRDQVAANPTTQSAPPQREADVAQERQEKKEVQRDTAPSADASARDSFARRDRAAEGALSARAAPSAPTAPPPPPAAAPLAEAVTIAPETRQLLAKAPAEFESPGGATRWRVVNGQVQRSTTEGKSWELVALPSAATLTAGHSPAPSVVWVVGRGGAVFVTTDGNRFARVPFPHAVDLASILAVDDRQATVVTVDGRVFGTSDRGTNWFQP